MKYKSNDAPDNQKVSITLSMGQVRYLDKLIGSALSDVEEYGEDEFYKSKPLQKLCDVFFPLVNTEMSEAEQTAATQAWIAKFTKDDYERIH